MLTPTEENYLKAIYKHSNGEGSVTTNVLAAELNSSPGTVTDMLKKLAEKKVAIHAPYKGVRLTEEGAQAALQIIRKHRLWEVFLVDKLQFTWDEVHETAEQLEHIHSEELVNKLDIFLGFPRFDPHGDPIPDNNGIFPSRETLKLADVPAHSDAVIAAVLLHTQEFLQYLSRLNLKINSRLHVLERLSFDDSRLILLEDKELALSSSVTQNLLVYKP